MSSRDATLADPSGLEAAVEAILFASGEPGHAREIAAALSGLDESQVDDTLAALQQRYENSPGGLLVERVAGAWRLATKPEVGALVRQFFRQRNRTRLSPAALESLAIVAFKQPITRIKIEKGDIEYLDANRAGEPFRVQLQPLGIELAGLSTLPEDRGNYLIAAKLPGHGGTLNWKGDVSLNPVKSDGEVALEGVSLTRLLTVIKTPRNFELPSGTLAAGTRYRFALVKDNAGKDRPWLQINGANLVVQDLALAPRGGGAPVLELAEARVGNANLDLYARKIHVAEVSLKAGKLAATRAIDGALDWQKLFAVAGDAPPPGDKPQTKPAAKAGAAADVPWKLAVQSIRLEDWSARFTDNGYVQPLRMEAAGFGLNAALAGEIGSAPDFRVGPVNASLGPVKAFSGADQVAELGNISLSNANYDVAANDLTVEALELSGLKTAVQLDKDKRLNWNRIPSATAPPTRPPRPHS